MKIYIDNRAVDTYEDMHLRINIRCDRFAEPDNEIAELTGAFTLPATMTNRLIMGDVDGIFNMQRFNSGRHAVVVKENDCVIAQGVTVLVFVVSDSEKGGHYVLKIAPEQNLWVAAAKETMLNETAIYFDCTLDGETIENSWTWDKPVRFLPVIRNGFEIENVNSNLFAPVKMLSASDYHPFVHIRTIIAQILSQSGYSLRSKFMDSEFFGKLYMSGRFPSHNTAILKSKMDFLAGKFSDRTAKADRSGCVYANPNITYNTVGNIVDAVSPYEQQDGVGVNGVFSNGGCLRIASGRLEFKPVQEVSVSFRLELKYKTDYVIESRTRLRGFDKLYLGEGDSRTLELANPNKDRRNSFSENFSYTLVVLDHVDGEKYIFQYDRITDPYADPNNLTLKDLTTYAVGPFTTRSTNISIARGDKAINPRLKRWEPLLEYYVTYLGDWTLYDGYVKEKGEVEVEAVVITKPETLSPGNPKYFDLIYFGGADEGMNFTLYGQTRMKPVFMPVAVEGTETDFAGLFAHRNTQMELMNAIGHMFNLNYITDHHAKTLYIEPAGEFRDYSAAIDWSDKLDTSKPVTIEEFDGKRYRTVSLSYRTGDENTSRFNQENGTALGKWTVANDDVRAANGNRNIVNPMFTPGVNVCGKYAGAPSVSVIEVGDSNESNENSMNFLPKIVSYAGVKEPVGGEIWGWPSSDGRYPMAAFHEPQSGASLCFEDRDGMTGLHRFYDGTLDVANTGKRITAFIHLDPEDIEQLQTIGHPLGDVRSAFRLCVGDDTFYGLLERIEGYAPSSRVSAKCIFVKL